jgi:hypothetical protein
VRHGPFRGSLDVERMAAYAATTGETLDTWAELSAVRAGTKAIVHFEQVDADGRLAAEQWWDDDPAWRGWTRRRRDDASPTPLGADLTTNAYRIDAHAFAFDARCGDARVISHGRLELRS